MEASETNEIMAGMDELIKAEEDRLNKIAPRCHYRPMLLDSIEDEYWWECSVCGHHTAIATEGSE